MKLLKNSDEGAVFYAFSFWIYRGINFCGYKINEYRLKLRDRGKRKLKLRIKKLKQKVKTGEITSHEAKRYLAGHIGYIKWADIYNLSNKLFYIEDAFNVKNID